MRLVFSRVWRQLPVALAAALIAGCDGDGEGLAVGVTPDANVSGTWSYSATNVTGGGLTCRIDGVRLELEQTGNRFNGIYTGGALICAETVGVRVIPLGPGIVTDGRVQGANVTFDFDGPYFRNTGVVDGLGMSGTLVVRADLGDPIGVVTVAGNFSAMRQ